MSLSINIEWIYITWKESDSHWLFNQPIGIDQYLIDILIGKVDLGSFHWKIFFLVNHWLKKPSNRLRKYGKQILFFIFEYPSFWRIP